MLVCIFLFLICSLEFVCSYPYIFTEMMIARGHGGDAGGDPPGGGPPWQPPSGCRSKILWKKIFI